MKKEQAEAKKQTYRTQIVMHTAQMIATYMHQEQCIKESAKLNANTMDG